MISLTIGSAIARCLLLSFAGTFISHITNSLNADAHDFDIIAGYSQTMCTLSSTGMLYNLLDTAYLDFETAWWPQNMLEEFTIANKLCICSGDIAPTTLYMLYGMFYNKDMLKNYAELIEPSQHVDEGTWTMETMLAMTSGIYNDLNNNQKADKDDSFGFTSLNWHFDAIYYGCGMTMLEKDPDPTKLLKIADDWTSEKAISLGNTVG